MSAAIEGADDRGHRMKWDAGKLRNAPPVCAGQGAGAR